MLLSDLYIIFDWYSSEFFNIIVFLTLISGILWLFSEITYFEYTQLSSAHIELEGLIEKKALLIKITLDNFLKFINVNLFSNENFVCNYNNYLEYEYNLTKKHLNEKIFI